MEQVIFGDARPREELDTRWLLLHCELMPWSAKAMELLRSQYAAAGAAATRWWERLTTDGGEGMVVKPLDRTQAVARDTRARTRTRGADPAVGGEPLWRVHQPVSAVPALESEPVDPRL